jgi:beta-galactosidase
MRDRALFDADWRFIQEDVPGAEAPDHDDAEWQSIDLPHDWSIAGPFDENNPAAFGGGYLPGGIGWYRKRFDLTPDQVNGPLWLEFDGVYKHADVWINGEHLGFHPYGYTSFYYDLADYVREGENVLAVRVDNSQQPDTRWYTGSGIYRHVWLTSLKPVHVDHWGVFATTPEVTDAFATVLVRTVVVNETDEEQWVTLLSAALDAEGAEVGRATRSHPMQPGQAQELIQRVRFAEPRRWSIEDPYLYTLQSEVLIDEEAVDRVETPIGIRTLTYDVDRGFFLNGEHVKLNGMCIHHDGGPVGAAVPERVWERRFELLKAMGCNAIRSSHYPPAPEFLDLCDRMGFVVMDEAFDEWAQARYAYGYHEHFDAWAEADMLSMLHRDRNHPSGVDIVRWLVDMVHREDPTRPATSACDLIATSPAANGPTQEGFLDALDLVGYNYVDRWAERRTKYFEIDRELHPDRIVYGSEDTSMGSIRGEYSLETERPGFYRGPYYSSMFRAEQLWEFARTHDYVLGHFAWTGIDYLGEARWPNKNSSSGLIDLCGFPKDGYYYHQSQWTDAPMVHLFPHWNWEGHEGEVLPVICYTNCDSVELFVNGKSWGVKSYLYAHQGLDRSQGFFQRHAPKVWPTTGDRHVRWDVPYEPGTLRVVGRRDGEVVCEQEIVTAGAPARLALAVDPETIAADGREVVHVTVRVLDAEGNLCPKADDQVQFAVEGAGRLIAVGNGNPASHKPFQAGERHAFNGLCLAIVQSDGDAGEIQVTATAEGLEGDRVTVEAE